MAAASSNSKPSGGSSGGNSLGGLAKSGLVYSIGMERFATRAQQAVAAARPLIQTMQQLTAVSDRLSDATGNAIKLPAGNLQATTTGLQSVQRESLGVISRFGSLVGGASLLAAKLVGVVSVLALVSRAKAVLTGNGTATANALGLAATATGVFGGKIGPVAGLTNMFVSVMRMLPGQLGEFGSKALAAGLALGVMSGGIGPITAGFALMSVGLRGIPGLLGKVTAGIGALVTSLGLAKIAMVALTATVGALTVALVAVAPALTFGVKLAAQAEQSQIAFETMLGSAMQAKQLISELRGFAIKTPFQEDELIAAGRSLIAFGESASNIVPALQRIGDVSSGIGAPIGEIAELYGKARVQGRLFAVDINQLTNRGIPIIQELAKQFHSTDSAVKSLVESGQVEFKHLEQAFISLTSQGGRFFDLTSKQSRSLLGQWSTFKDGVSAALREVGNRLVETGELQRALVLGGDLLRSITPVLHGLGTVLIATMAMLIRFGETAIAVCKNIVLAFHATLQAAKDFANGFSDSMTMGMWQPFDDGTESANKAIDSLDALQASTRALADAPPVRVIDQRQLDRYKEIKDMVDKYSSSLTKLQAELREIDRLAPNPKFEQAWRTQAFENATGIVSQIRAVSDEIDVLSRKSTVGGQKLRDMLAMGVPPEMVDQLRQLQQQRDSLKERGNLWNQASSAADKDRQKRESARKEMQQLRESIDPAAKLKGEIKRSMELLKQAGGSPENRSAIAKFQEDAVKNFRKEINANDSQTAKNNQGLTAGTSEAMSAIIAATTSKTRPKSEYLLELLLQQSQKGDTDLDKRLVELIKVQEPPAIFTIGRN